MTDIFKEGLLRVIQVKENMSFSQQILAPIEIEKMYQAFKARLEDDAKVRK